MKALTNTSVLVFKAIVCLLIPTTLPAQAASRPNIIFFMADDLGFSDIGAFGSEIETPNLNRLAKNGLRYTRFHNASVCCPSRASLMTGLYPHAAGMGAMNTPQKAKGPAYQGQLRSDSPTVAEAMRKAGYSTWMVGKWHLTRSDTIHDGPNGSWPMQRGFDRFYGTMEGAKDYFQPTWLFDGDREVKQFPEDFYYERALSSRAAEWIRGESSEKPFFLYVAFYAPHFPLQAPPETIARYRGKYRVGWDQLREERLKRQIATGIFPKETKLSPRTANVPAWDTLSKAQQDHLDHRMAIYAAQVDELDQAVGRVLRALEETKRLDNTLIVFLSDNGGGSRGGSMGQGQSSQLNAPSILNSTYGSGWANLSNTPFRRYKTETHAGGNSAPLIVHWPNGIRDSGIRRQAAHIMDLMPTALEVAGTRAPIVKDGKPAPALTGRSLVPTFQVDRPNDRNLFWEFGGSRAVLAGDWKLVALTKDAPWELYDLKTDRTECNDLANERPEKIKNLEALWKKWANEIGVSQGASAKPESR